VYLDSEIGKLCLYVAQAPSLTAPMSTMLLRTHEPQYLLSRRNLRPGKGCQSRLYELELAGVPSLNLSRIENQIINHYVVLSGKTEEMKIHDFVAQRSQGASRFGV
jgi:hypothetical protein